MAMACMHAHARVAMVAGSGGGKAAVVVARQWWWHAAVVSRSNKAVVVARQRWWQGNDGARGQTRTTNKAACDDGDDGDDGATLYDHDLILS